MRRRVEVKAYAKINLALDVLGRRDDGFHEVEMVMQGINLNDQIEIALSSEAGIKLVCSGEETGPIEDNLAYQAARLLLAEFDLQTGVSIKLNKDIPVAAGLAGGSADGAAVLMGLDRLLNLDLTEAELHSLAVRLGSDVPFCLSPTTALATGRGEVLRPIASPDYMWLVLFKPDYGVSTAQIFRHLSNLSIKSRPDICNLLKSLAAGNPEKAYQQMANVLEYSTFDLYPQLRKQAREIEGLGAKYVMMTGSGPTLVAFTEGEQEAVDLASKWSAEDWRVIVTRTIDSRDLRGRVKIYEGEKAFTGRSE